MAHNFIHRLFTGSKGPPTRAFRGIGKPRMASFKGMTSGSRVVKSKGGVAGRARVGPKTMQISPTRRGPQSTSIGSPKGRPAASVSARQGRTSARFKKGLKRRDR